MSPAAMLFGVALWIYTAFAGGQIEWTVTGRSPTTEVIVVGLGSGPINFD